MKMSDIVLLIMCDEKVIGFNFALCLDLSLWSWWNQEVCDVILGVVTLRLLKSH